MVSAASTPAEDTKDRSRWAAAVRSELGYLAEIAGLAGFAIAQPVLSPFGESPETFLAVGATPGQIVRFALAIALVPPLVLWAGAAVTRLGGATVRRIAQAVLLAVLAGAAAGLLARSLGAGATVRAAAAILVGAVVAGLRARDVTPLRLFLRYTAPVPVLLAALFLFSSPVAPLVRPPDADVGETAAVGDPSGLPPVVVVVLDELPTSSILDGSGAIEGDLFPNLARVADTSTWYRNHTTGAAATLKSLPILLTGRYPEDANDEVFPTYDNFPDNLFTLLGGTYDLRVSENLTKLCPDSLCPAPEDVDLDEDVEDLAVAPPEPADDPVGSLLDEARSLWRAEAWPLSDGFEAGYTVGVGGEEARAEVVSQTLAAVNRVRAADDDRPVFDFMHFALPHQPWFLLPSGRTHDAPDIPFANEFVRWWPEGQLGVDTGEAGESRMQLQLQWADRVLGTTIDRLEALGRWDDALVIITADHGISFETGTSTRYGNRANQRSVAWAPLFVKLPGQTEGAVNDDPVQSIDVVATIVDVLGIEATWELEGQSLLDGPPPADRRRRFATATESDLDPEGGRNGVLDADGLARLRTAGRPVEAGDELGVWKYGRLGDLIGESVDELGVCEGTGPEIDLPVTAGWSELVDGTLAVGDPLPLWHEGTIAGNAQIDVVGVVDGRVVGWSPTVPQKYADSRIGMLFAEPLVTDPSSNPVFYEVVDGEGCRLRPLAVG